MNLYIFYYTLNSDIHGKIIDSSTHFLVVERSYYKYNTNNYIISAVISFAANCL
jgi:hypothetical protein